ncbi:ECF-type sigma factor [Sphingomonas sp. HF-S4]|uniref:ECF-type sigma factor n=1 Tax=Sphingomonas agrestis TaxID=3080540 RepID=A0ABU3Y3K2_9SPHN|nr:ECF-type sigma factor [Sphingomonas sp. HF-S4]MDV3455846.1 ECF-type sigma factor [Sphingomonas sp. HF-S4]
MASDSAIDALYADLHRVAQRERFRAGRPNTLQTTAILHEAYIKLSNRDAWDSREHFLATAATTMRHVLIDAARERMSAKRGAGIRPIALGDAHEIPGLDREDDEQLLAVGLALQRLEQFDPELAKLVDCRFFVGLSERETGEIMGFSERTVRRRWSHARAWIHRELSTGRDSPEER